MEFSKVIMVYAIYLPTVVGLTLYVSRSLFKNGKIFMLDIFHGKEEIALSTNRLFEIGFYLTNIGFALYIMKEYAARITTYQHVLETLSVKIGGFSIYLGVMLFFNLFLFFRGRRKSRNPEKVIKPSVPSE